MTTIGTFNEEGVNVDLYIPRKCHATNTLITSYDHSAVQIAVAGVDANGVIDGTTTAFCIAGYLRSQGESDHAINHLAIDRGIVRIKTGKKPRSKVNAAKPSSGAAGQAKGGQQKGKANARGQQKGGRNVGGAANAGGQKSSGKKQPQQGGRPPRNEEGNRQRQGQGQQKQGQKQQRGGTGRQQQGAKRGPRPQTA
uniref:Uncharacterized protein TCIL3000_11_7110 n=1 Tax=Trypanosoma congolense (strain IL3000) TaxID=1068625 RepID=G0V0W0_TRYCI|nr:unnamed protein product [Trypanosoma congolense IL3000]CCC95282.1 unnamed protein product [Trypanosoma congolense IL3000]